MEHPYYLLRIALRFCVDGQQEKSISHVKSLKICKRGKTFAREIRDSNMDEIGTRPFD
jgi:hypothetical protein